MTPAPQPSPRGSVVSFDRYARRKGIHLERRPNPSNPRDGSDGNDGA